jgi:hypothetical protein
LNERYIGRAHTWVAFTADGALHTEHDHGSLRAIPQESPVVRVGVVATDAPDDSTRHYSVLVPEGGTPICFWRISLTEYQERSAITVIGWERDNERTLLWVYDDGSCLLTDRDIEEYT